MTDRHDEELVVRYNAALVLIARGRDPEALAILDSIIRSRRTEVGWPRTSRDGLMALTLWVTRAGIWRRLGRTDEALASLDSVVQTLERLDPRARTSDSEDLLVAAQTNSGNALDALGRRAEALARYDRALHVAARMAPRLEGEDGDKRLAGVLVNRAQTLAMLGRETQAAADFERVFELVDRNPGAEILPRTERFAMLVFHAKVLWSLGEVSRAEERFDEAIRLGTALGTALGWVAVLPRLAVAQLGRARAQVAMGLESRALASFDAAEGLYLRLEGVTLVPPLEQRLAEVAGEKARFLASRNRREDALVMFDRALAYLGDDRTSTPSGLAVWIHGERGRTLYALRRFAEARDAFALLPKAFPADADAPGTPLPRLAEIAQVHASLGASLLALRKHAEALEEFQKALELFERVFRTDLVEEDELHYAVAGELLLALTGAALAAEVLGRLDEGERLAEQATALARELVVDRGLTWFSSQAELAGRMLDGIRSQRERRRAS